MAQRSSALVLTATLIGFAAAPVSAQAPAECRTNFRSNFRLNGAQQHLTVAERTSFSDDRTRRADQALNNLREAASAGGADQFTLWMFFGQAYALKRDYVGADSAYRRAEAVATPECKADITRRRRNEFVPFNNQGVAHMQAQRFDSALASFRQGLLIFRGEPAAYINMAGIFLQQEKEDSAVAYFRLGAQASDEPRTLNLRSTALFNAGRLMQRSRRWPQADSLFREYLRLKPGDAEARSALATVLTMMGRTTEAVAMYDSTMANSDSLESFDLFDTGVALFRLAQADTARGDSMRRRDLFSKAARAFELGLRKNPSHRDALFNLTNTFIASGDSTRALEAAKRLVAIDPLSFQSLRLVAAAYQRMAEPYRLAGIRAQAARDTATIRRVRGPLTAYQDSTVRALARAESLAVDLQILRFEPRDSSAVMRGLTANRQNREQAPFNLVFEFINATGEVVSRETVEIPALNPAGGAGSAVYDFNITTNGRGIIAYRYSRP